MILYFFNHRSFSTKTSNLSSFALLVGKWAKYILLRSCAFADKIVKVFILCVRYTIIIITTFTYIQCACVCVCECVVADCPALGLWSPAWSLMIPSVHFPGYLHVDPLLVVPTFSISYFQFPKLHIVDHPPKKTMLFLC